MTITRATSNAGCKKVFPQILVCQVFRWPQIVFHHDIKSSNSCQNPGVIKPPNSNLNTSKDEEDSRETICVNPYHYELTQEAETRFKKQNSKTSPPNKLNQSQISRASSESNSSFTFASDDDEEESDNEIIHYEDDGIDYAQLWDQKVAELPINPEVQSFKIEELLDELKIFTLNKEMKSFNPAQKEILEKLGVIKELKSMIGMGL